MAHKGARPPAHRPTGRDNNAIDRLSDAFSANHRMTFETWVVQINHMQRSLSVIVKSTLKHDTRLSIRMITRIGTPLTAFDNQPLINLAHWGKKNHKRFSLTRRREVL